MANGISLFCEPLVWAKVMDVIQKEGISRGNYKTLLGLLLLTVLIEIVSWSLHGPARLMERRNAFLARLNYRKHLLLGVMTLPMEWHVDHHSGDTIDKVEKGTSSLYRSAESSFEILSSIVQLIGSYAMLVYFSSSSAYIVMGMICLTVWITMRFDKVIVEQYKHLNKADNQISESTFDAISNIATVIILRVERLVFRSIVAKAEKPFELYKQASRLSEIKWFLTSMCCAIMTALVLGMYFWNHIGTPQGVLIGSVYLLIQYLNKISNLFYRFTQMYGEIVQRKVNILNSEELSADFREENFANHVLPHGWKNLQISNLSFSYGAGEQSHLNLKDVSLSIAHGERIAFVGASGSGKTTLLAVMRDLYHPRSLTLSVDGVDIAHGFEGISRAMALVPQNPEIFATTILDNITIGAEYDMNHVLRYTDMACFTDVALSLPSQFNSSIKERGVNLSGGQQQRLALSRGLLACDDKDIVLLDEPTSSLDTTNEMRVYTNIFREFKGKTVISSIHRLHLLPLFDRICMFEEGRIIATGTLSELLSSCSQFQVLWNQYSEHQLVGDGE